jgi:hypothetical protein
VTGTPQPTYRTSDGELLAQILDIDNRRHDPVLL